MCFHKYAVLKLWKGGAPHPVITTVTKLGGGGGGAGAPPPIPTPMVSVRTVAGRGK